MKSLALVIGNGFSIGFNAYHNISYNTLNPLAWDVRNPEREELLIDALPSLKNFIRATHHSNDFELFDAALALYNERDDYETCILISECRHFLTLAFSQYSLAIANTLKKSWPWYRWIKEHRQNIKCISSFNYDLLIEKLLKKIVISFYDASSPPLTGRVMLHKPHGSSNYDAHPRSIVFNEDYRYPLKNCNDRNDTAFVRIGDFNLNKSRLEPLCVIPNEHNIYSHYQTMLPHDISFHKKLSSCDFCLIIGHSYAPCDRPEIDKMLSSLPLDAKVIICNPKPPEDLKKKIKSIGLKMVEWKNPSGPIDENGELIYI
ncbi:hypothetical protein ACMGGR_18505 [Erwinia sp. BNK-24-b]|uniref:hypothetical protein n=1 Tax=unclassified Erwinia TaxID=2622719 RepID=UPI0039BF87EC